MTEVYLSDAACDRRCGAGLSIPISNARSAIAPSVMLRQEYFDEFCLANAAVQRLPAISAFTLETCGSPLRPGCYAAALLTTLLFADFPLLENEHRVSPKLERVAVQGLQSRHHSQVTGDL